MSNERFFRMLSVALLGAFALAGVPDSEASSAAKSTLESSAVLPVEVQVVKEVDEINAGRFNPAVVGKTNIETVDNAQTVSRRDPNF